MLCHFTQSHVLNMSRITFNEALDHDRILAFTEIIFSEHLALLVARLNWLSLLSKPLSEPAQPLQVIARHSPLQLECHFLVSTAFCLQLQKAGVKSPLA